MSNYITCGTTGCPTQPGVCLVGAIQRDPNTGIRYTNRHRCSILGLAVTQFVFGIILIAIGSGLLVICSDTKGCGWPYYGDYYYEYYGVWTKMGTNIWGGLLIVLFASFGLFHGCAPSKCSISTNFALSMVGIFLSLGLMGLEMTSAFVSLPSLVLLILHSIACSIYFILFVIFIASASCAGTAQGCCGCNCTGCCCCDSNGQQQIVSVIQAEAQPHVVRLTNGQTVLMQASVGNQQASPAAPPFMLQPPQYNAVVFNETAASSSASQSALPVVGAVNQSYVTDIPHKA